MSNSHDARSVRYEIVRRELQRPVPLGLALLALLGWLSVAYVAWSSDAQRRALHTQLDGIEANRRQLIADLEGQQQASRNLAELEIKIKAEVAAREKELLQSMQQQLAKLDEDFASRFKEMAGLEAQLLAARQELAELQEKLAASRRELSAPPEQPAR